MTSPLRPSFAASGHRDRAPVRQLRTRGHVLDGQLDAVDPDLRLPRRGQIAVQDLAVADLDAVDARGHHALQRVANVGNARGRLLLFLRALADHDLRLIQPRARRQPRVEQLAPVDARRDALRVEQRVLPVVLRMLDDLDAADRVAGRKHGDVNAVKVAADPLGVVERLARVVAWPPDPAPSRTITTTAATAATPISRRRAQRGRRPSALIDGLPGRRPECRPWNGPPPPRCRRRPPAPRSAARSGAAAPRPGRARRCPSRRATRAR